MNQATIADAEFIAKQILKSDSVKRVYLFGSVADKSIGHDLDIAIEVSNESMQDFYAFMSEVNGPPYDLEFDMRSRKQAFEKLIGSVEPNVVIDAFAVGEHWIGNIEQQNGLSRGWLHLDFLEDIAPKALPFDVQSGHFVK